MRNNLLTVSVYFAILVAPQANGMENPFPTRIVPAKTAAYMMPCPAKDCQATVSERNLRSHILEHIGVTCFCSVNTNFEQSGKQLVPFVIKAVFIAQPDFIAHPHCQSPQHCNASKTSAYTQWYTSIHHTLTCRNARDILAWTAVTIKPEFQEEFEVRRKKTESESKIVQALLRGKLPEPDPLLADQYISQETPLIPPMPEQAPHIIITSCPFALPTALDFIEAPPRTSAEAIGTEAEAIVDDQEAIPEQTNIQDSDSDDDDNDDTYSASSEENIEDDDYHPSSKKNKRKNFNKKVPQRKKTCPKKRPAPRIDSHKQIHRCLVKDCKVAGVRNHHEQDIYIQCRACRLPFQLAKFSTHCNKKQYDESDIEHDLLEHLKRPYRGNALLSLIYDHLDRSIITQEEDGRISKARNAAREACLKKYYTISYSIIEGKAHVELKLKNGK